MQHAAKTLFTTRRFTVVEYEVANEDGKIATCQSIHHPGAVVVLPLLPDNDICLIRNHRLTVGSTLIELPAGTREADEPAIDTARRELTEETGYRAGRLEKLAEFYTSPGITDEKMLAFVAHDLVPGPPAREENEQIENLVVPLAEAHNMIQRGEILDGKTIATLLLYINSQ